MARRTSINPHGGAFTLIELLVVVSIISVLTAILLPSLQRAREQAKNVVCKNNLRSIWTGIFNYAMEYNDHVPLMENVNVDNGVPGTGPNADPFDEHFPTTAGVVLMPYVNPDSWVCPSAIAGYPADAGPGGWKLTYTFGTFDKGIGDVVPWDVHGGDQTGGPADVTNYWPFDGRPLSLLDGRRYTRFAGVNENAKGRWSVRFPLIADMVVDEDADSGGASGPAGVKKYIYPHRGRFDARNDLQNARDIFYHNSHVQPGQIGTGRYELFADQDRVQIFFTRSWEVHADGY